MSSKPQQEQLCSPSRKGRAGVAVSFYEQTELEGRTEKQHSILGIRHKLSNNIYSNHPTITASLHLRRLPSSIGNSTASVLVHNVTPSAHQKFKALIFAVLYLVLVCRKWKDDRALMTVYEPRSHTPFFANAFLQLTYPTCGRNEWMEGTDGRMDWT